MTLFGQRRFISMRDPRDYHEQADHARRLADITVQRNVEEILRRVAEELDRLADKMGPIPLIPRGWNLCQYGSKKHFRIYGRTIPHIGDIVTLPIDGHLIIDGFLTN